MSSNIPADRYSEIETLARETNTPVATVREIYTTEHAKLARVAKIKTFIPVLIRRHVKELLRSRRSASNVDRLGPSDA